MKLLDLLVEELPKHGGWPRGAVECERYFHEGNIDFYDADGNWPEDCGEKYGYGFAEKLIKNRSRGEMPRIEMVTREQYELAIQENSFEVLCRPIIKWINDNGHPHQTIIIDATSAVLYSGEKSITTEEFIKD